MKKGLAAMALGLSMGAQAAPVEWTLVDFLFNDGATASGSFVYDSDTDRFGRIDIRTTDGPTMAGRHYVAPAGVWGSSPAEWGVLAFSDTAGPDFQGAGWLRIDANIDFQAAPGTIVGQSFNTGAESFCTNSWCNSAANELTNPGLSRDTVRGYLRAAAPVPEPSSWLLGVLGVLGLMAFANKRAVNNPASRCV